MVDLHSHILPGIDDGAKNMEETLKMGKIAETGGFSKIIATPHYIEGEFTLEREQFLGIIDKVNEHFIGTDAHTPRTRSPRIKEALEQMRKWVDNEYIEEIVDNGWALIRGEEIIIPQPLIYKPKKGFLHSIKKLFN